MVIPVRGACETPVTVQPPYVGYVREYGVSLPGVAVPHAVTSRVYNRTDKILHHVNSKSSRHRVPEIDSALQGCCCQVFALWLDGTPIKVLGARRHNWASHGLYKGGPRGPVGENGVTARRNHDGRPGVDRCETVNVDRLAVL